MSPPVHTLADLDLSTNMGLCRKCGWTALYWKNIKGEKKPRCGIAVEQQRQTPGRRGKHPDHGWATYVRPHGLTGREAKARLTGALCEICGRQAQANDHDHATGALRGTLCHRCNILLGYLKDDAALAEACRQYLVRYAPARLP